MTWCKSFGLYTLIGTLLGIGFVITQLWWVAFFGVGLLLLQLQTKRKRQWVWVWYAWSVKYLFSLYWFWSVYPIEWLGVSLGGLAVIAIAFYWFTAALWLGSGACVLVYCYQGLQLRADGLGVAAVPFLWLVAELWGAFLFSIATYGQGATIGSQFSFGFIGFHAAQHPWLIQTAAIAGVYALTVVFVAISAGAFFLWRSKRKLWLGVVSMLVIVSSVIPNLSVQPTASELVTVAVIDTQIAPSYQLTVEASIQKTEQLQEAFAAAQQQQADYIIFPEDSRFFDHTLATSALTAFLQFQSQPTDAMVLDSSRVAHDNGAILQSVWFDAAAGEATFAHKSYLVPQGEFMPYLYYWMLRAVGFRETAETLRASVTYVRGDLSTQRHFSESTPGVLFCFEGVDPKGVRKLTHERDTTPPFVAHIVSHGWFNEPKTLWPQLESMLRVQAIWNDTYIVSAGNQTLGYTVSPAGQLLYPKTVAQGEQWRVGIITF